MEVNKEIVKKTEHKGYLHDELDCFPDRIDNSNVLDIIVLVLVVARDI